MSAVSNKDTFTPSQNFISLKQYYATEPFHLTDYAHYKEEYPGDYKDQCILDKLLDFYLVSGLREEEEHEGMELRIQELKHAYHTLRKYPCNSLRRRLLRLCQNLKA